MPLLLLAGAAAAFGVLLFSWLQPRDSTSTQSRPVARLEASDQFSPEQRTGGAPPFAVPETRPRTHPHQTAAESDDPFAAPRRQMVTEQLQGRDITAQRVLEVMGKVPRHRFVSDSLRDLAYADRPLPIGHRQTISQPYIVALMTQLAQPRPGSRALDIGTGSGYQAAVLAELVQQVYSIEILQPLADKASTRLKALGYKNIEVRCGDGYQGWPEHTPFDVIIVAAAPDHVPQPLIDQLAPGGRLVIPVGDWFQDLLVIEKDEEGNISRRSVAPVAFVPMTGKAQQRDAP